MDIKAAIKRLTERQDLDAEEMTLVMRELMSGNTTDAQIGAFLVALQMKGVKTEELLGGATVMRELVTRVALDDTHLVDTCGTGGSGSNKFNVSTAAAMVAATAGARVAKHGNRGATSKSGSADVLEAAGVNLALTPEQVAQTIEAVGVGFMFAPAHHSAMKHVITARREIGVRTLFNMLGPLTNPAGAPNQVIGVFDGEWIPVLLETLARLGSKHILIVAAEDGLDEISISAATTVGELHDGKIFRYTVTPEELGVSRYDSYSMLQVDNVQESLAMMRNALDYSNRPAGDIVALNAGAALYAAGVCPDLKSGVVRSRQVLESGEALTKLEQLVQFTGRFSSPG
ncbi:MAG: anthranilate phosphoribosyltransferase [Pseudohongiellaceae bacterium]